MSCVLSNRLTTSTRRLSHDPLHFLGAIRLVAALLGVSDQMKLLLAKPCPAGFGGLSVLIA
jgi:hypothetical protein